MVLTRLQGYVREYGVAGSHTEVLEEQPKRLADGGVCVEQVLVVICCQLSNLKPKHGKSRSCDKACSTGLLLLFGIAERSTGSYAFRVHSYCITVRLRHER